MRVGVRAGVRHEASGRESGSEGAFGATYSLVAQAECVAALGFFTYRGGTADRKPVIKSAPP